MRVGIVGHEAAKFTAETEAKAREVIRFLLADPASVLISGHCHLGGVDIWAEEEAAALGRSMRIHPPAVLEWDPPGRVGFKVRNSLIAWESDVVHCLVVKQLPREEIEFKPYWFKDCYHCKGRIEPHVKSGGCWTAWRCPQHQWWLL